MFSYPIENLITHLEIVADHCDTENHKPMVVTIYEAIETLIVMFNLLNKDN